MNIKFFKARELDRNLKATISSNGKMGFTTEAAEKLNLGVNKSLSIGMNNDDNRDKNLYILVNEANEENDSFPILRTGSFYYVNTKSLFKTIKIEFKRYDTYYEITKEIITGNEMYVFELKQKERKTSSKYNYFSFFT
ncbi:MAG: hypothetical protein ACOH2A_11165 [Sphingobacteriaceae bacterium]